MRPRPSNVMKAANVICHAYGRHKDSEGVDVSVNVAHALMDAGLLVPGGHTVTDDWEAAATERLRRLGDAATWRLRGEFIDALARCYTGDGRFSAAHASANALVEALEAPRGSDE